MKTNKLKKILHIVSIALFNVMAVLFGITLIFNALLADKSVTSLLSQHVFKDTGGTVTYNTGKAPVRYKTWYSSIEDTLNGNGEIAWYAQKEGTVLLKNDNNALPLSAGEKVSLYGVTAYDPMYSLDGAGNSKINDPQAYGGTSAPEINRRQFFYDEFAKVGLTMNSKLQQWYNSDAGIHYRRVDTIGFWGKDQGNGRVPYLTEANWNEIDSASKDYTNFGKSTTAIYITGRMTNEDMDLTQEGSFKALDPERPDRNNDGEKNKVDYLAFTDDEKNLLSELGKNYDKVIVLFNQANPPQEDIPELLKEYGIEAAMWIGYPGSDGIKAIAEILSGKYSPSGGLSAAWYTARENNPSTQNFAIKNQGNVVNMEGMYVGYRYAETRYEDVLEKNANAGEYNYGTQISYPFGYGLSYTTFSYTNVEVVKDEDPAKNYYSCAVMTRNDPNHKCEYCDGEGNNLERPDSEKRATGDNLGDCDDLIVKVTVTNTGKTYTGKEIVQVYLQQPVTNTDKAHGVQKPSVQLVGYGKTGELAPGASEVVEVKIDANKWFAAYDAKLEKNGEVVGGYTLAAGDYLLAVARNSNEAVNSIYKSKTNGTQPNAAFVDDYGAGKAENVKRITVSNERSQSYAYWTYGATDDVHNLFADIAPDTDMVFNRYDWAKTAAVVDGRIGANGKSIKGSAATGSFHKGGAVTSANIDKYAEYYGVEYDDTEYKFGWSDSNWKLLDLIGVEYDPARGASEEDVQKWSELVGQMSKDDFILLFSDGLRKTKYIESVDKPATNDQNASNGFEWMFGLNSSGNKGKENSNAGFMYAFDESAKKCYPTGYPCEGIRAASFNNYVAYLVGQAMGEDALWGGASGLYGFGLGLQRNPYHGRAGEFYSDDSFLTGMIGAYETLGAQEKGLYVYNKHFVLNDQDTDRTSYQSWLDEQTFRQIYLRPFEMAIEIGDAMNVMVAFNKIGTGWAGNNYNLMTRWLRGEAGMRGFAISDWYPAGGENLGYGMLSGMGLLDGPLSSADVSGSIGNDARYDNMAVEAATRILYTVANSNAMNFYGDSTVSVTFDPEWYATRDAVVPAVSTTVYVFFGLSLAFVVGMTAWKLLDQYIFKKEN